jgi:hypothetical protein
VTTIEQDSAAIARMLVALMRTVSAVYYPGMQTNRRDRACIRRHSRLPRVRGAPSNDRQQAFSCAWYVACNRGASPRLETLIEVGYVKRQENFYCPEEGVINTPYLRDVLARASEIVITTAKELSKMDTEA